VTQREVENRKLVLEAMPVSGVTFSKPPEGGEFMIAVVRWTEDELALKYAIDNWKV